MYQKKQKLSNNKINITEKINKYDYFNIFSFFLEGCENIRNLIENTSKTFNATLSSTLNVQRRFINLSRLFQTEMLTLWAVSYLAA